MERQPHPKHDTPRRKRRTSQDLRDRILDAAAAAFEAHGYDGATTAAIARRADVTETQLFRAFASKQALFRAAIFEPLNRHFADFNRRHLGAEAADAAAHEQLSADYIGELLTFMERHARMLMSLVVASAFDPQESGLTRIDSLADYFERGAAQIAGRLGEGSGVDPALLVRVSFAAVLGHVVFRHALYPGRAASDEAVRAALVDFILHGIHADRPPPGR